MDFNGLEITDVRVEPLKFNAPTHFDGSVWRAAVTIQLNDLVDVSGLMIRQNKEGLYVELPPQIYTEDLELINYISAQVLSSASMSLALAHGEEQPLEESLQVGRRVRAVRSFSGVPAGTEGVIDEDYGSGWMVAWDLKEHPLPSGYNKFDGRPAALSGILRDGFDKKREGHFLEVVRGRAS